MSQLPPGRPHEADPLEAQFAAGACHQEYVVWQDRLSAGGYVSGWDSSDPEQCDDDVNEYAAVPLSNAGSPSAAGAEQPQQLSMIWCDDRSQSDVAVFDGNAPRLRKCIPSWRQRRFRRRRIRYPALAALTDSAGYRPAFCYPASMFNSFGTDRRLRVIRDILGHRHS